MVGHSSAFSSRITQTKSNDSSSLICAVIVTFNPEIVLLHKVVEAIIEDVAALFIVDNNSDNCGEIFNDMKKYLNVQIITSDSNQGYPAALNKGIEKALDVESDVVLLLAHDTVLHAGAVREVKAFYDQHKEMRIGIMSANLERKAGSDSSGDGFSYKRMVFSTGIFVPRQVFERVGLFNRQFFIYHEDDEFCIRVRKAGFKIVQLDQLYGSFKEGAATAHIWFPTPARFLRTGKIFEEVPIPARKAELIYYIARNGLYIAAWEDPSFYKWTIETTFFNIVSSARYFGRPWKVLKFAIIGLVHGALGTLGIWPPTMKRKRNVRKGTVMSTGEC